MSINSSSFLSFALPVFSSNSTNTSIFYSLECEYSVVSIVIHTIYTFTNILILIPLYILILYMGFKHWKCHRSAPAGKTMSNSDFFTYNIIILEIVGVFGSFFKTFHSYTKNKTMFKLGRYLFSIMLPVQVVLHVVTCVERYLAVVHPITYRQLRESHGFRIRNISTVCAWLMGIGWLGIEQLYWPNIPAIPIFSYLGICSSVIFFCYLSVLHTLTHPGPGEVGGKKEQVDQSKQRAFHMIMAIMGVLLLRFVGIFIYLAIKGTLSITDTKDLCFLLNLVIWLTVPNSLVLPLLFLHRAGKLSCCRKKI